MANTNPYAQPGPPRKTPAELELERQLGGPVLAAASNDRTPSARGTEGEAAAYAAGNVNLKDSRSFQAQAGNPMKAVDPAVRRLHRS